MANLVFDFLHNYVTGERRASDPADAYQYDEGHVLEAVVPVAVASCEIQYWIRGMEKADAYTPTSITQNTDNTYTILGNIPNSYFETNGDLRVYIVVTDGDASITTYEGYIHIKERQMPEDYVDDDPDNEAVRVIAEAQAAAATATQKASDAAASAEQAQEILDSIPEDYSQLTEDVSNLKDDLNEKAPIGTVGFNIWDEEYIVKNGNHIETKNYIPVEPETEYYLKTPVNPGYGMWFYDENYNRISTYYNSERFTTPANCRYIKFGINDSYGSVYNNDICLNISQPDTSISPHNGDYVPSNYLKNYADVIKNKLDIHNLSASTTKADTILNESIDAIGNATFRYTEMVVSASATGWRLNEADGLCSSNSSYKLIKYQINAGESYRVISDDRFQFQTSASVPSAGASNRVGTTFESGTFIVKAPQNATYLVMSSPVANSSATCYTMSPIGSDGEGIAEVKKYLNNARHICGGVVNPLTLLHFSDLHADAEAMNRIVAKSADYDDMIDGMICTGDIVANTYAQITSWWNEKIMTCIGNHDTASYSNGVYNWTALNMANRDAYYIAPFESEWGIVHTSGTSYYYKDYIDQNVRLIVMDAMLYNDNGAEATAQTTWLSGLLSDATTNDLHVIIAIHAPHGGATAIECSFSKYNQVALPTYTDCNTPQIVIDTVANAIENGLHFIGYIVGHTHQDNIWDAESNGKQLMYCITCASVNYVGQWENSDQNRNINEDAFNLITIDTQNTLVKIIRGGGADIDDHMRTRKAICFNYSTGEMVGEVL